METKHCKKCSSDLPADSFNRDKSKKDGLRTTCSSCDANQRAANKEQRARTKREWYLQNKDHCKQRSSKKNSSEYNSEYYRANREEILLKAKLRSKENPGVSTARSRKYQASKLQRTPPWADMSAVVAFYTEAKRLEELTGIKFHVDHIVPLQGELVSGLHVESNLQLLTAHENQSKSNSFAVAA
jgi:hypothetical protein